MPLENVNTLWVEHHYPLDALAFDICGVNTVETRGSDVAYLGVCSLKRCVGWQLTTTGEGGEAL